MSKPVSIQKALKSLILLLLVVHPALAQTIEWVQTNGPVSGYAGDLIPVQEDVILAIVNGDLYRSTDEGITWREVPVPRPNLVPALPVSSVAATPDGVVFAATGIFRRSGENIQHGLFRSSDAGRTFVLIQLPSSVNLVYQFEAGSGSYIFAHTDQGLFRTHDDGATWHHIGLPLEEGDRRIQWIAANRSGIIALMLSDERVLFSTDNGTTWDAPVDGTFPPTDYSLTVLPDRTLIGWHHGAEALYISTDQGQTWVAHGPNLNGGLIHGISLDEETETFYLGTDKGAFRSDDYGETWTSLGLSFRSSYAFATTSSGTLLAHTDDAIYRQDDGTWAHSSDGIFRSTTVSLAVRGDGALLAGGFLGDVSMSTDHGDTWRQIGFFQYVEAIVTTPGGRIFIANGAGEPSVYSTADEGETWETHGLKNINMLHRTAQGTLLAGRQGLYRSTNEGTSWETAAWESELVFDVVEAHAVLYAGGSDGVWRSTDDGVTWTHLGLAGKTIREVAVHDGVLYAFALCSFGESDCGLFRSSDGGASWSLIQSFDPAWSIHELLDLPNGDIYACFDRDLLYSKDQGETWRQASAGLPTRHTFPDNSPLTAIVVDGDGYLYVGTHGRSVYRTTQPIHVAREGEEHVPEEAARLSIYPNPVRLEATLVLQMEQAGHVRLAVYDVTGRQVAVVADEWLSGGEHQMRWRTEQVPSGVYFCRLRAGQHVETDALVLQK